MGDAVMSSIEHFFFGVLFGSWLVLMIKVFGGNRRSGKAVTEAEPDAIDAPCMIVQYKYRSVQAYWADLREGTVGRRAIPTSNPEWAEAPLTVDWKVPV